MSDFAELVYLVVLIVLAGRIAISTYHFERVTREIQKLREELSEVMGGKR